MLFSTSPLSVTIGKTFQYVTKSNSAGPLDNNCYREQGAFTYYVIILYKAQTEFHPCNLVILDDKPSKNQIFGAVRQKRFLCSRRLYGFSSGPKGPLLHLCGLKIAYVLLDLI